MRTGTEETESVRRVFKPEESGWVLLLKLSINKELILLDGCKGVLLQRRTKEKAGFYEAFSRWLFFSSEKPLHFSLLSSLSEPLFLSVAQPRWVSPLQWNLFPFLICICLQGRGVRSINFTPEPVYLNSLFYQTRRVPFSVPAESSPQREQTFGLMCGSRPNSLCLSSHFAISFDCHTQRIAPPREWSTSRLDRRVNRGGQIDPNIANIDGNAGLRWCFSFISSSPFSGRQLGPVSSKNRRAFSKTSPFPSCTAHFGLLSCRHVTQQRWDQPSERHTFCWRLIRSLMVAEREQSAVWSYFTPVYKDIAFSRMKIH